MGRFNVSGSPSKSFDDIAGSGPNIATRPRAEGGPRVNRPRAEGGPSVGSGRGRGTGFRGRVSNTWENLSQKARNMFTGKSGLTKANSKTFKGKKLGDQVTDISKNNKTMTIDGKTKSFDELSEAPNVKSASRSEGAKLARVGLKGAGAVAALMILTGNKNPINAVKETVEGAADLGKDLGKGLAGLFEGFGEMFALIGSHGKYVSSASSCMLLLIAFSTALSAVK
mgnify:CR=1 FL=1|tara:strand:+ start:900 stop:1577 length:678 start_codon:yes stop_codon:yes gene_type:complete